MNRAFVFKVLFLRKGREKTHRYNVIETKCQRLGVKPGGGQSMGKKAKHNHNRDKQEELGTWAGAIGTPAWAFWDAGIGKKTDGEKKGGWREMQ